MDYLLGLTENKNHPNTELNALHLSDDAITVLTTGNFNHRLLSEMICHKDFRRMMLDDEYFGHVVSKDLTGILRDIRDTHRKDATTADENSAALDVQKQLQDAMDYKGSTEEKKARLFLTNLGIDYDALTMEQFANLIDVLKLSKHMNSLISQRGKGSMTHGKGKKEIISVKTIAKGGLCTCQRELSSS